MSLVSFQINISVKISAGLLQNLRGNLDEKFGSDQSSGLIEMFQGSIWMRWGLDKLPALSCSRSFSRQIARLSAGKVLALIYPSTRSNCLRPQHAAHNV